VNPLANIYAGLNYATHRYGAGWTSFLGQGHGYDRGGFLPTGLSLAYNGTGRPEMVIPGGRGGGAATIVNVHVELGPGTHPVQAARAIFDLLNEGAKSGMRLRRSIIGPAG
jgi:SLT domain-containing protein